MNVLRFLVFSFCVVFTSNTYAQDTAVADLDTLLLNVPRGEAVRTGTKLQTIKPEILHLYPNANLSDLLTSQSTVFMKSYGSGGIATPAFRGTAAEHTAVLWNGFNLTNPMLGLFDFSLVPNMFVDEVNVQYGSASSLFGSGAIGGVIHLRSRPEYGQGLTLNMGANYGSFNTLRQHGYFQYSSEKFISKTKVFSFSADNNYLYINTEKFGEPEEKLAHARVEQIGLMQDNYFKISKNQQIGVHFWHQEKEALIPPTMTQTRNTSVQKDRFNRATIDWVLLSEKTKWQVRTGYFNDWINFEDVPLNILSSNHYISHITEGEVNKKINNNQSFNLGYNNTYISSRSIEGGADNLLNSNPKRRQHALFGSFKQEFGDKVVANISNRVEMIDGDIKPITPAVGAEYSPEKNHLVRVKGSRNYRLPTLNNLYWKGSGAEGNPDLEPELGWGYEVGYNAKRVFDNSWLEFDVAYYTNNVDNWILWVEEDDKVWRPQNIREVWSRGVELNLGYTFKIGDSSMIRITTMYNYVKSTVEATEVGNNELLGKQLIYTPKLSSATNLSYRYKDMFININLSTTGERYTTTDNSSSLPAFSLLNLAFSKRVVFKGHYLNILAKANNILDEEYQVLQFRPMPRANYEIGINLNLNKQNN